MKSSPSQWKQNSPILDSVERIICKGVNSSAPDERSWHKEAQRRIEDIDPKKAVLAGLVLYSQLPLLEIDQALKKTSKGSQSALVRVKRGRKVLFCARDTLLISSRGSLGPNFDPLFRLTRGIGEVADRDGDNPEVIESCREHLSQMLSHPIGVISPAKKKIVAQRFRHSLQTKKLILPPDTVDSEKYHDWRKGFRRAANLLTLYGAYTGDKNIIELAASGMALNRSYGNRHKNLLVVTGQMPTDYDE